MSLHTYLDTLFGDPVEAGPGPSTAAYREWEAYISAGVAAEKDM